MVIFHSYVSLPEGMIYKLIQTAESRIIHVTVVKALLQWFQHPWIMLTDVD